MILVWPDGTVLPDGIVEQPGHVLVTAWDPAAEDGGRACLLTSVRDARAFLAERDQDPDGLTLVGFGRGAVAAAGLAHYAKRLGIGLGRVTCIAPQWDEPDPFSGSPITEAPERIELVARWEDADYLLATTLRRT